MVSETPPSEIMLDWDSDQIVSASASDQFITTQAHSCLDRALLMPVNKVAPQVGLARGSIEDHLTEMPP
jgi:hypothetical protein